MLSISNMFFKFVFVFLVVVQFCWSSPLPTPAPEPNDHVLIPRAPATFKHPGVLVDKEQLDFIKGKVNAGEQPWTDAYNAMMGSNLASPSRTANPTNTVVGPISLPILQNEQS
jgi:hypothetical protein